MKATILSILKRDIVRSFRDNILLYVILSPLLLAVLAAFLLPSISSPQLKLAVDEKTAILIKSEVKNLSDVKIFSSFTEIEAAVLEKDDRIGVVSTGNGHTLILQGNENSALESQMEKTLIPILEKRGPRESEIDSSKDIVRGYVVVFILMTTMMLGGMVAGFLIVEERSAKTLLSASVTPTSITQYILAKAAISFLIPLVVGILVSFIATGSAWSFEFYLIASIGSAPVGILLGLLMGYFADNQIAALGINKLLIPVFLTIPLISLFVPASFKWIFYVFPNFWMFQALQQVYIPGIDSRFNILLSAGLALLIGVILLIMFIPRCARRLGLRIF